MELQVEGRSACAYTGGKPLDPSLPCVVLVHGALHDHSVWTLAARWLAHHGHSVLALDLPAHGRSAGPPPASVAAAADWLWAVLDAAGVAQAALVGHSMGSLIALEAAARAPQRASALVLVGTAYPMKVSDALLNTARDAPFKAIDMVNALSHSSIAGKPAYPGPGVWLHGANRALMRRTQAAHTATGLNLFHHDFSLCNDYAGGLQAAAQVQCPAHAILGAQDQMTPPKTAAELTRALKAQMHTLPCGHALMQEQPDALLQALRQALGVG